eukprot:1092605-Prymnesium_polylepis.1
MSSIARSDGHVDNCTLNECAAHASAQHGRFEPRLLYVLKTARLSRQRAPAARSTASYRAANQNHSSFLRKVCTARHVRRAPVFKVFGGNPA